MNNLTNSFQRGNFGISAMPSTFMPVQAFPQNKEQLLYLSAQFRANTPPSYASLSTVQTPYSNFGRYPSPEKNNQTRSPFNYVDFSTHKPHTQKGGEESSMVALLLLFKQFSNLKKEARPVMPTKEESLFNKKPLKQASPEKSTESIFTFSPKKTSKPSGNSPAPKETDSLDLIDYVPPPTPPANEKVYIVSGTTNVAGSTTLGTHLSQLFSQLSTNEVQERTKNFPDANALLKLSDEDAGGRLQGQSYIIKESGDINQVLGAIPYSPSTANLKTIDYGGKTYDVIFTDTRHYSPLTFDLNGDGVKTSDKIIQYDIDGDGSLDNINDVADGTLTIRGGATGKDLFGDNTDLDGDGKADGFKNGFDALKALALQENLIDGKQDMVLDANDLKILEKKYQLAMKTKGYNSANEKLADLGISEINLGKTNEVKNTENFDGQGNDLMTQDGSTFMLNGKTQDYADVWHKKHGS